MIAETIIVCISFFLWFIYRENKRIKKEFDSYRDDDLANYRREEIRLTEKQLDLESQIEDWKERFFQSEKHISEIQNKNHHLEKELERIKFSVDDLNLFPEDMIQAQGEMLKNAFGFAFDEIEISFRSAIENHNQIQELIKDMKENKAPSYYRLVEIVKILSSNIKYLLTLWKQQNS